MSPLCGRIWIVTGFENYIHICRAPYKSKSVGIPEKFFKSLAAFKYLRCETVVRRGSKCHDPFEKFVIGQLLPFLRYLSVYRAAVVVTAAPPPRFVQLGFVQLDSSGRGPQSRPAGRRRRRESPDRRRVGARRRQLRLQ